MYYNNQIWHWGVKGMKWGVRRYQNADGSLTDAGKHRYSTDAAANAKKKKDNRLPGESLNDPNRWVKEDRERTKRVVDSGNQMAGNLKTLNDKSMRIQARRTPKMDLSKMTDQEMREQINRAMLEKQYDDVQPEEGLFRSGSRQRYFGDCRKCSGHYEFGSRYCIGH